MKRLAAWIAIPCALVAPACAAALDYPSAWACDQVKFNWYCDTPPPRKSPEKKGKTREEEALERIEAWKRELEAKRALSILEPTPENLKAYIKAQERLMQTASVYSDVWRRVIWQNPELNYELKRPVNNAAIATYTELRRAAERRALDEIRKDWGLFFFFRSDCPYCQRLAPTLRFLSDTYGITVFPVSLDGGGLPEYPTPHRDNGMAGRLAIEQVPALVLGNVRDRRLIPIASGVVSAQDIIERIYILTSTVPGQLY